MCVALKKWCFHFDAQVYMQPHSYQCAMLCPLRTFVLGKMFRLHSKEVWQHSSPEIIVHHFLPKTFVHFFGTYSDFKNTWIWLSTFDRYMPPTSHNKHSLTHSLVIPCQVRPKFFFCYVALSRPTVKCEKTGSSVFFSPFYFIFLCQIWAEEFA